MKNMSEVAGISDVELADLICESLGAGLSYGASFPTELLREIVGLSADTRAAHLRWLSVSMCLKTKLLLEHQMYLRSTGSGVYTIVRPEQQASVAAEDEVREIRKALSKATHIVAHNNIDELTHEQLRKHDDVSADRAARADLFRREIRRRKRWDEK